MVAEERLHCEEAFTEYLRWYLPRTRTRVTHTPQELPRRTPSIRDTYPVHMDQASAISVCILFKYVRMSNTCVTLYDY